MNDGAPYCAASEDKRGAGASAAVGAAATAGANVGGMSAGGEERAKADVGTDGGTAREGVEAGADVTVCANVRGVLASVVAAPRADVRGAGTGASPLADVARGVASAEFCAGPHAPDTG